MFEEGKISKYNYVDSELNVLESASGKGEVLSTIKYPLVPTQKTAMLAEKRLGS